MTSLFQRQTTKSSVVSGMHSKKSSFNYSEVHEGDAHDDKS
jgi:hypothetical protein